MKLSSSALILFGLGMLACGTESPEQTSGTTARDPNRGGYGKADLSGSCTDGTSNFCGGASPSGCYCDEHCAAVGDCCSDARSVCEVQECRFATDACPLGYVCGDGECVEQEAPEFPGYDCITSSGIRLDLGAGDGSDASILVEGETTTLNPNHDFVRVGQDLGHRFTFDGSSNEAFVQVARAGDSFARGVLTWNESSDALTCYAKTGRSTFDYACFRLEDGVELHLRKGAGSGTATVMTSFEATEEGGWLYDANADPDTIASYEELDETEGVAHHRFTWGRPAEGESFDLNLADTDELFSTGQSEYRSASAVVCRRPH